MNMKHQKDLAAKLLEDFHGNEVIIDKNITSLPTVSNECIVYFNTFLKENQFVRISIIGGGCSGFQYSFCIEASEEYSSDTDIIINSTPHIIIDTTSMEFMRGAIIQYEKTNFYERVYVDNPGAKQSCSCGNSFDYT